MRARCSVSPTHTLWIPPGSSASSTRSTSSVTRRAPKRSAWSRNFCIISGPMIPSGKPGIVLDVGRLLQQAAPGEALEHERAQVGARRVQRGRVAGRAAADDDHVLDVAHLLSNRFNTGYFTKVKYSAAAGLCIAHLTPTAPGGPDRARAQLAWRACEPCLLAPARDRAAQLEVGDRAGDASAARRRSRGRTAPRARPG